jgi:hypothetical protein
MRALCFHHVNSQVKRFSFAGSHCRSRSSLLRELDGCVLLCLNCHGEVHDGVLELQAAGRSAAAKASAR